MIKRKPFLLLAAAVMALTACLSNVESETATPLLVTEPGPTLPQKGPASVEVVEIHQIETFPVSVNIIARGHLPDGCTTIDQISQTRTGSNFKITIDSIHYAEDGCSTERIPFEEAIELDVIALPAGIYVVDVNGLQGTFTLQADNIPDQENAVIGGQVWLDACKFGTETLATSPNPPSGCLISDEGTYIADGLVDPDESGIGGIVLKLGEGACPATGLGATITDDEGRYLFSGLKGGTYCVSIDENDAQNRIVLAPGQWTYPQEGQEAAATIALSSGESNLDLYFGWQAQSFEPAEPTPEECTDKAIFREDITIPDDSVVEAGETFTKTWRLQNIGSCTWDSDYGVVFFAGDQMEGPETIPISATIAPGEEVNLPITLIAPLEAGEYRGEWKLTNPEGFLFGIGPGSDRAFWVQIVIEE